MARSPQDATRFTPTGPHASRASTIAFSSPPPPNETPQQKIARLREASRRAKLAQESKYDKIVARGRVWADRAHRFTTMSLIIGTGLITVVAVFSLSDMVLYNRRKREEFFTEQQKKMVEELKAVQKAITEGTATQEQIAFLNEQVAAARAARDAEEAKKSKRGIFKRLFGGSTTAGEEAGAAAQSTKESVTEAVQAARAGATEAKAGIMESVDKMKKEAEHITERAQEKVQPTGGPLDQKAQEVTEVVKDKSKGWTSWLTGR